MNIDLLEKEKLIYIDKINIKELKDFCKKAINKYGNMEKFKKANKVADVVYQKFEFLNYINKNAQQQFVDITIAAALLHNLFYDKNDISTILVHRTKLKKIENDCNLDNRLSNILYELIECQLGETHPIQKLKPQINSPGYTLAEAVWQVNNYESRV